MAVNPCSDQNCEDIMISMRDAEQMREMVEASIPEQFFRQKYNPADDIVGAVDCLVCGDQVPLLRYERGPRVCDACRDAILAIRNQRENK